MERISKACLIISLFLVIGGCSLCQKNDSLASAGTQPVEEFHALQPGPDDESLSGERDGQTPKVESAAEETDDGFLKMPLELAAQKAVSLDQEYFAKSTPSTVAPSLSINQTPYGRQRGSYYYGVVKFGPFFFAGDLKDLDTGYFGEILMGQHFSPFFSLELGIGYMGGKKGTGDVTGNVYALPISFNSRFTYPLESIGELYAGVGMGFYFARVRASKYLEYSVNDRDEMWGYHGFLGANFSIGRSQYIGLEAKYIQTGDGSFDGVKFSYSGWAVMLCLGSWM